jgi:aminopeptidase N
MPHHESTEGGQKGCAHTHGAAQGFPFAGSSRHYAPDVRVEPRHIRAEYDFQIKERRATCRAVLTVVSNDRTARTIALNAIGFADVDVKDEEGNQLVWTYDGELINVTWADPIAKGQERKLHVAYVLDHPVSGMQFSCPDEAYPTRPLFAATDNETERARYWLPCVDFPQVRQSLEFLLTSEESHTLVANGVLQSEVTKNGRKTAHWKLDFACPSYLACIAAGEFELYPDETVEGVPIAYIACKGVPEESVRLVFGKTPAMMKWLTKKVGHAFPFPKYYQIIVPKIGGAMENISLVTWDDVFMLDKNLAAEWGYVVDSVNIHEMAHSYFGDALVIRHFEHAWLKESWATYIEAAWVEDHEKRDEFEYEMWCNASGYFSECSSYQRPIVTREYKSSWQLFDSHLYPGGAWRIHMLRRLIGDSAFWAAVQAYVGDFHQKIVETVDFQRALEKQSGRNLTKFFDQWLLSPGYPKLKGKFDYSAEKKQVRVSFEQTQKDEKQGVGFFEFALDVEVVDESGAVHQGVVEMDDVTGKASVILSGVTAKPKTIRVDPEQKVLYSLEMNPGLEILTNTAKQAQDVGNRIWAGKELAKLGTRPALRALREVLKAEPFWGVRVQLAKALAEQKNAGIFVSEILAEVIASETDPRAFMPTLNSFSSIRDEVMRSALRKWIEAHPYAYRGQWAALQALGNQRNEEDLDLLTAAASLDGPFPWTRNGGIRGLGNTKSPKARDWLEAKLAYGQLRDNAREAAIGAYAECTAYLYDKDHVARKDAVTKLTALLREEDPAIKKAAVTGLVTLRAAGAASAIRSLRPLLSNQTGPWLDSKLKALQEGAGEEVTQLKKKVEELEAAVRKLEDKQRDAEEEKKANAASAAATKAE